MSISNSLSWQFYRLPSLPLPFPSPANSTPTNSWSRYSGELYGLPDQLATINHWIVGPQKRARQSGSQVLIPRRHDDTWRRMKENTEFFFFFELENCCCLTGGICDDDERITSVTTCREESLRVVQCSANNNIISCH